jgi:hypothetical protein
MLRCMFRFICRSNSVVRIMISQSHQATTCGHLMVLQIGEDVSLDVAHKHVFKAECIAARLTQANTPSPGRVLASAEMTCYASNHQVMPRTIGQSQLNQ